MKHLKYLRYVLLHKWFVFLGCCELGIPIAGVFHDLSKFLPSEWRPYADFFYGGHGEKRPQHVYDAFMAAWMFHQRRNPHHWQYWVLTRDDGRVKPLEIPDRYRREMLADWRGVGRALGHGDDVHDWYDKNKAVMKLHKETRKWIENELNPTWVVCSRCQGYTFPSHFDCWKCAGVGQVRA